MLEVGFGDSVYFFEQVKCPDDFGFHLVPLPQEELLEVAFVEDDGSALWAVAHVTKLQKLPVSATFLALKQNSFS
ncbi:MAG: hypothetical protein M3Y54_17735 [Bacteroidota bacterium]|nr:hypothetical protein [Bacteroidota bacterium]